MVQFFHSDDKYKTFSYTTADNIPYTVKHIPIILIITDYATIHYSDDTLQHLT